MSSIQTNSTSRISIIILLLLAMGVSCYMCLQPLIVSIDSVWGFLAYKGTITSGNFNTVVSVSPANLTQTNESFISWWSPGQWMIPAIFDSIPGIKPGVACIITTIVFAVGGLTGYYKVFRFYNFPPFICLLSLLIIFFSGTFNYSFIIYQGGEILSFGIFPWFLLYAVRLRQPSIKSLLVLSLLFLLCFIAKNTLIIYCLLILFYKLTEGLFYSLFHVKTVFSRNNIRLAYIVPVIIVLPLVLLYILQSPTPANVREFDVSVEDVFLPLCSPLGSILSIQSVFTHTSKILFPDNYAISSNVTMIVFYAGFLLVNGFMSYAIVRDKKINEDYKALLLFLYAGIAGTFMFFYFFNAPIDHSARHFKLLGFLFIPGLLSLLFQYVQKKYVYGIIIVTGITAITGFVSLKQKWASGRYVSENYFLRDIDNIEHADKLDEASYRQLILLDRHFTSIQQPVIFFAEANEDVPIDLNNLCILKSPQSIVPLPEHYRGSGILIVACIQKQTLATDPTLLQRRFPDYHWFRTYREVNGYVFMMANR